MGQLGNSLPIPHAASIRVDSDWLPLLREALARGEHFRWPLRGSSMRPSLPATCQIEIAALEGKVRLGSLIVFACDGELVAHRLVNRSKAKWITQGDGCLGPDRPLDPSQVLGAVVAAHHEDGRRCWPGTFARVQAFLWIFRYHALRGPRYLRRQFRGM